MKEVEDAGDVENYVRRRHVRQVERESRREGERKKERSTE